MKKLESRFLLVGGLMLLTFGCGVVLSGSYVSADDSYNADVSLTIPVACTMTGTLDTPHTANVNAGTYVADIGTTTLKTVCNDGNGFSIYAIGYSGLEYGNNKMLATVGGTLAPTYDIATGTATSGDTSNWAMKLNAVTGTYAPTLTNGFGSYRTVPTEYTKVATLLSGTDATIGSSVQSTYAVYTTSLQPAGSYNGKVKYTLVHPNDETPTQPQTTQAGKICYYPNGSNVEGTMGCQTIPASGGTVNTVTPTSATLLASNFSRAGYGFAGWSTTFDYSDDTGFLGPQEYIEFPAGTYTGNNDGLSLYARWIKSAGSLQGWTGCSSLQSGAVTALTDQRDNETYAVAKLADGNCWMIENLRLADKDSSNNDVILSSTNTNNPSLPLTNIYDTGSTSNHLSPTSSIAYAAGTAPEGWCTTDSAACDDQSRIRTDNTANRATYTSGQTVSSQNAKLYSYGNYYNWYSATAGNGTYSFDTNNNSVGGDLCPTGWRLPKGGDKTRITSNNDNEFWNLIVTGLNGGTLPANYDKNANPYYDASVEARPIANALRTYPNNFIHSGYLYGVSFYNRGNSGYYWSSTAYDSDNAYYLTFGSTYVSPGTSSDNKYYGWTVRCVATSP